MNLSLQTKENVLFPESNGEQEKSGSDGEREREARLFLTFPVFVCKGF